MQSYHQTPLALRDGMGVPLQLSWRTGFLDAMNWYVVKTADESFFWIFQALAMATTISFYHTFERYRTNYITYSTQTVFASFPDLPNLSHGQQHTHGPSPSPKLCSKHLNPPFLWREFSKSRFLSCINHLPRFTLPSSARKYCWFQEGEKNMHVCVRGREWGESSSSADDGCCWVCRDLLCVKWFVLRTLEVLPCIILCCCARFCGHKAGLDVSATLTKIAL